MLSACNSALNSLGPHRLILARIYNLQQAIIVGGRRKKPDKQDTAKLLVFPRQSA